MICNPVVMGSIVRDYKYSRASVRRDRQPPPILEIARKKHVCNKATFAVMFAKILLWKIVMTTTGVDANQTVYLDRPGHLLPITGETHILQEPWFNPKSLHADVG